MKTIVITGAGRGIGYSIGKSLLCNNNKLVLITKSLNSKRRLASSFPNADIYQLDLSIENDINSLIQNIHKKYTSIDVLINNAGFYIGKRFEKTAIKELDNLYKIHLRAPFILIQQLLPLLKKAPHPQIINISSAANYARLPTESAYTSLKASLSALGDVLQKELQKQRIRLTTIHPWTVNTKDLEKSKNYLKPEDIASIVSFIISSPPSVEILNIEVSALNDWRGNFPS